MKLTNIKDVDAFLDVVNACTGDVWLESSYGDKFNLKSKMCQFVAIAALITTETENLELFCSKDEDQQRFFKLFNEHPAILSGTSE